MNEAINLPLLGKLLVVLILAPAWLPIVKALWQEVNDSLVEEGGIFGKVPERDIAENLAHRREASGESLCSLSKEEHKRLRRIRSAARSSNQSKPSGLHSSGPVRTTKRRSF